MKETETQKAIAVDDLQNQVRDHIKSYDLFDWHEALTENEMSLLENLLLTFAPKFYPGSIGFKETVQPYVDEKEKRIGELEEALRDLALQYKMVVSEQLERVGIKLEDEIDHLPAYKKSQQLLNNR